MKNFFTSVFAAVLVLLVYVLFFAPRPVEPPEPPKVPQIKVNPVVLTLIQQNSAPNYQIVFDSIPAEAPEGWKVVSVGRSGDIITISE